MRKPSTALLVIFAFALVVRVAFLLLMGPLDAPDTGEYKLLAHNLLATGQFAHTDAVTGQWVFYAFRMPLYHTVIALIYRIIGETRAADWTLVLLQALLSAGTAVCAAALGGLTVGWRIGLVAGFFFAVDPLSVLHTAYIMTDTLFAFLVMAAILVGVRALQHPRCCVFFAWGFLIGAATMTRPLLKYYSIIPVLSLLLSGFSVRKSLRYGLVALCGAALLLGPWAIRNKLTVGFWGLELNQGMNSLWSTLHLTKPSSAEERQRDPQLAAARDVVSRLSHPIEVLDAVKRELNVPEAVADKYLTQIGIENALRNPIAFAFIVLKNGMNVMTSPVTVQELIYRFGIATEALVTVPLSVAVKNGLAFPLFVNVISRCVAFGIFCIGACWGLLTLWRDQRNRSWLVLLVISWVYFVGLTSAVAGYDRYRLPIEGVLWVLSAVSIVAVTERQGVKDLGPGSNCGLST